MIRILIADDHSIIRDGLKALLKEEKNIEIIGEAANGFEVIDILKQSKADIVVMDINMPKCDGLEATKLVLADFPEVKVIALTMNDQSDSVKSMVEAGVWGYLFKDSSKAEFIKAIETVAEGRKYFNNKVFDMLMMNSENNKQEANSETSILTIREKEVLKLVAEEYSSQEIADKLFLSVKTVNAHRRNLVQKLDAKNTAALVRYAIKHGLIKLEDK
jgi:DNA-binding NarL/FixJ family response regulator